MHISLEMKAEANAFSAGEESIENSHLLYMYLASDWNCMSAHMYVPRNLQV